MNSLVFDDLSRENLALLTANCLSDVFVNNKKVTGLHKELLEINLTIAAYIEESKKRLREVRLDLAHQAQSSQEVVEVLSQKINISMSTMPPQKINVIMNKHIEDNNNTNSKFTQRQQARTFISWYKRMIDHERQSFPSYLADDISLEWFGRTIKSRKKVSAFIKFDMQCSRHDFTSVESIDKIQNRLENLERKHDNLSKNPSLHSPELIKTNRPAKRRSLRSNCYSPEWAEGCGLEENIDRDKKKLKLEKIEYEDVGHHNGNGLKRRHTEDSPEISYDGDGMGHKTKRKCVPITPTNKEIGQGDCYPSTSGTDSNKSHDALNAQLPKLAVECNGYIEFTRTRNNRSIDAMKWDRKCKLQISYSEDPLNVGEYIIWALRYTDESKCRRNLLSAFEEVAKDDGQKSV